MEKINQSLILMLVTSALISQGANASDLKKARITDDGMSTPAKWDSENNSVFAIAHMTGEYCSGTIIAQKWLLTAGHCGASDFSLDPGEIYDSPAEYINFASTKNIEQNGYYNTYDSRISVIGSSFVPDSYKLYASGDNTPDTNKLDVSLWELSKKPLTEGFLAISNIHAVNGDIVRMYGFGQTKPELNYLQQKAWMNTQSINSDQGYLFEGANIDQGTSISGDSGAAFINEGHYIVGVLRSSFTNTKFCESDPHCQSDSEYGTGFYEEETQAFVLRTINAWNAPNVVRNVSAEAKTIRIQSLHMEPLSLLTSLNTIGDVDIDLSSIVCFTPDMHKKTLHNIEQVEPYDVCEISLTSNGGEGVVTLDEQEILINPVVEVVEPPVQGGDASGGSMGFGVLLGMLGILFLRTKQMFFNKHNKEI